MSFVDGKRYGPVQRIVERGDMGRVQAAISRGMGDVTRVEGIDRVKGGKGVHTHPQQDGSKIPSPMKGHEVEVISSLRVLSSPWHGLSLTCSGHRDRKTER